MDSQQYSVKLWIIKNEWNIHVFLHWKLSILIVEFLQKRLIIDFCWKIDDFFHIIDQILRVLSWIRNINYCHFKRVTMPFSLGLSFLLTTTIYIVHSKVIIQGMLFQRWLYCSVLSLGGNVNTDVTAWHGTFHIKNKWNILVIGNYYVNYQNFEN